MKGYKLVKVGGKNELLSSNIHPSSIYKIGEFVEREDGYGPLCVFEYLVDLYEFLGNRFEKEDLKIFECEFEKSEDSEVYTGMKHAYLWELPDGTVLADRVKLLKEIET